MYNTAPKYKKIEILLNKFNHDVIQKNIKTINENDKEESEPKLKKINDPFFSGREKCVFEDAALIVTGGYILITQDYGNDEIASEKSTTGRIFDLKDVHSYKAYFEQR
jgi:hypothetical protein